MKKLLFLLLSCCTLSATPTEKAIAILHPTEGNQVKGRVSFTPVQGGVLIVAEVEGLEPGKHGFHIHEYGDCSASDASSAGGHYNPHDKKHGAPTDKDRHVGDLGNLQANSDGKATYEKINNYVELDGEFSVLGKSVIVHEKRDDFTTQPTGDAGKRLACGVIKPVE